MRAFSVVLFNEQGKQVRFRVPCLEKSIFCDEVFYADSDAVTEDEVKRSLVDHDGYPENITVLEI